MLKLTSMIMFVSAVLLGSLIVNAYLLTQIYSLTIDNSSIQKQIDDFRSQIADLQVEKVSLQDQVQIQKGTAGPRLVSRLGAKDVRATPYANHPWSGRIRFYVSGDIWNVGQVPAINCTLHIVLFQGATIANDTHVMLGTIKPGSFVEVSANVYYEGDALTTWNVTPETG